MRSLNTKRLTWFISLSSIMPRASFLPTRHLADLRAAGILFRRMLGFVLLMNTIVRLTRIYWLSPLA